MIISEPRKLPPSGQHWYTLAGEACHRQPDGKATTLREARTQNLVPSVSGIIGLIERPHLTKWKCDNMIKTTLKNPYVPGEPEQDYITRIHGYANIDKQKTLDFGSRVHKAIEEYNLLHKLRCSYGNRYSKFDESKDPELWPYLETYIRWAQERLKSIIAVEKTVVNTRWGYGGTIDLVCQIHGIKGEVIVDFKTQRYEGKRPTFHHEYGYQLAAYRKTFKPIPKCISLVINAIEPRPAVEKIYTAKELQRGWRVFRSTIKVWQESKKYEPARECNQ